MAVSIASKVSPPFVSTRVRLQPVIGFSEMGIVHLSDFLNHSRLRPQTLAEFPKKLRSPVPDLFALLIILRDKVVHDKADQREAEQNK
jgi:hypothetical protein